MFAVITQNSNKEVFPREVCPKNEDEMANSEDPDQTADQLLRCFHTVNRLSQKCASNVILFETQ